MIWLNNARILATFAVISLHICAKNLREYDLSTSYWAISNLVNSSTRWCVPVFIMISGALLLNNTKQNNLKAFYSKRLSKILIPIIFWTFVYIIWSYFLAYTGDYEITPIDLAKKILSGKPYYHMWFLYMIIVLYLFTPFFQKIVINSSRGEVLTLITATFIIAMIDHAYSKITSNDTKLFIFFFLRYIPFFLTGQFLLNLTPPKARYLWLIFLTAIALTSFGHYLISSKTASKHGSYFYGYLSITVVPMSISIMLLLKKTKQHLISRKADAKLSSVSFGIYLIHPIILEILNHLFVGLKNLS